MFLNELNEIIRGGESDQVEFKRSTGQRTDAAKAACAMLNTRGGFVLFGVSDKGEIIGQQVASGTLADVVHELAKIEPRPLINPEVVPVDSSRAVILVRVPEGQGTVYTLDGRAYVRVGPTNSVMGQEEYRRRIIEEMHPNSRWEMQPAFHVSIDDLAHDQIITTIEAAIANGRLGDPGTRDIKALLRGLGLIEEDRLLNAAVALFGRGDRVLPYYPQCLLRMAVFRGIDKTEFRDNRQVFGNVFELLDQADHFLRKHLPVAGRVIPEVFHRIDDPLYPPVALREALANAFCHRDYAVPGSSVSLAVYDDRLELTNAGRLPSGFTVDDLTRPHVSKPHNLLIASVLYRRGVIEQWGRGTLRMLELTENAGLPRVEFESGGGEILVRFRPERYVPPSQARHELTSLQQEILTVLAREGGLSSDRLRPLLSAEITEWKVLTELKILRHLGLVQKQGVTRGVRWVVVA